MKPSIIGGVLSSLLLIGCVTRVPDHRPVDPAACYGLDTISFSPPSGVDWSFFEGRDKQLKFMTAKDFGAPDRGDAEYISLRAHGFALVHPEKENTFVIVEFLDGLTFRPCPSSGKPPRADGEI